MKIEINETKCIKCNRCKDVCPENIFRESKKGGILKIINSALCFSCGQCVSVCPRDAILNSRVTNYDESEEENDHYCENIFEVDILTEFFKSHHSVRHFKAKEVEIEILKTIVDAGMNVPSAHNNHNIKAIIIKNPALITELSMSTIEYFEKTRNQLKNPVIQYLLSKIAPNKIKDVKALLPSFQGIIEAGKVGEDRVFFESKHILILYGPKNVTFTELDGALALSNCMNVARAYGIGSFIPGYFMKASENTSKVNKHLGIPKNHVIVGALAMGYPKHKYLRRVNGHVMEMKVYK